MRTPDSAFPIENHPSENDGLFDSRSAWNPSSECFSESSARFSLIQVKTYQEWLHIITANLSQGIWDLCRGKPGALSPHLTSFFLDSLLFSCDIEFSKNGEFSHCAVFLSSVWHGKVTVWTNANVDPYEVYLWQKFHPILIRGLWDRLSQRSKEAEKNDDEASPSAHSSKTRPRTANFRWPSL